MMAMGRSAEKGEETHNDASCDHLLLYVPQALVASEASGASKVVGTVMKSPVWTEAQHWYRC